MTESIEVINEEAVAVWNGCIDSTQKLISARKTLETGIGLDRGFLWEMRKGERAVFTSEVILAAIFRKEVGRRTDLAAATAITKQKKNLAR